MAAGARVCLGQIGAPHGVRGEVRLRSFTSDPQAIGEYGPLETEDGRILEIESLRPAKGRFVAVLGGVRDRDAAERLANVKLYIPRERLPPLEQADEFYHADLIGLSVVDRGGKPLGTVVAIHNFGAGDLLEVRLNAQGKTELIAFNEINVPAVDVGAQKIVIDPTPLAEEAGEAKPGRATADERGAMRSRAAAAAGARRRRSSLSGKSRG